MFCNQCGGELQPDFRVCPRCGKPLQAGPPAVPSRFQSHLKTLGILWMIVGGITLIPAFFLMLLSAFHIMIPFPEEMARALGQLSPLIFTVIGAIFLFIGVAELLVGWGLIQRERWARTAAIVVGVLALLHPPFGTLLGIYTLWVLLSRGADVEYQAVARAA